MHEKPVEPIIETQNPAAKPTDKSLLQKVPFPERLDKTKEEKQYAKFLETNERSSDHYSHFGCGVTHSLVC
jgi:hypothetical protein